MIEINERIIAIWYLVTIPGEQDFMGGLFRDEKGDLKFKYRFRYYNSDEPWDKKDTKNWYDVTPKQGTTPEAMIESLRIMVDRLSRMSGQKADEIVIKDGDHQKFLEEFMAKPWAHMKPLPHYEGQNRKKWSN